MPHKKLPILLVILMFSIYAKHDAKTFAREHSLFEKTLTPQAKQEKLDASLNELNYLNEVPVKKTSISIDQPVRKE